MREEGEKRKGRIWEPIGKPEEGEPFADVGADCWEGYATEGLDPFSSKPLHRKAADAILHPERHVKGK